MEMPQRKGATTAKEEGVLQGRRKTDMGMPYASQGLNKQPSRQRVIDLTKKTSNTSMKASIEALNPRGFMRESRNAGISVHSSTGMARPRMAQILGNPSLTHVNPQRE